MSAYHSRVEEIMEEPESSDSFSAQHVEILRLHGPICILYIEKDGSWKVIHGALMVVLKSKVDSVNWLMLVINLSVDDQVPNLIAYRYKLYSGCKTVLRTPRNELILLDYDNLNGGIVLRLGPTSEVDRDLFEPLDDIFEPLKVFFEDNFLKEVDNSLKNGESDNTDQGSSDETEEEDNESAAASKYPYMAWGFAQAMVQLRTNVHVNAPIFRKNAVGAFNSFLDGFFPREQNRGTSLISPEMIKLMRGCQRGSNLMAEGASIFMLNSGESLKQFGSLVEPQATFVATNMIEAFCNKKPDEAEEIVNDTKEIFKHSLDFVIAASDTLRCISKHLSAIPVDCFISLTERVCGEVAAEAWMMVAKIKDNFEEGNVPIKYVEKPMDLFRGVLRNERPRNH